MELELPGPPPAAYDVLVVGIAPEDLPGDVSKVLGVPHLSACDERAKWPLHGKVYGFHRRVIFAIPVSVRGGPCVYAHFVFDSNAPATFLATSTLQALGLEAWQLGGATILLNGRRTSQVLLSERQVAGHPEGAPGPCRFHGLNIFGMDFLDLADATLTVDTATNTSCIETFEKSLIKKSPDGSDRMVK